MPNTSPLLTRRSRFTLAASAAALLLAPPGALAADATASIATTTGAAPGATLSITLSGFVLDGGTGGQKVAIRIGASRDVAACVQTDAAGAATTTLTLPADLAPGSTTLRFLAGTACQSGVPVSEAPSRSIVRTVPAVVLTAPAGGATPGGSLTVGLRGWIRDDATGGQRVAIRIGASRDIAACVDTNASGDADTTLPLPAELAIGESSLRLLAGTLCQSGVPATDLPSRSILAPFTVVAAPSPTPAPTQAVIPTPTPAATPAPAPAPTPAPTLAPNSDLTPAVEVQRPSTLQIAGSRLRLKLRSSGEATRVKVRVRTRNKVRFGGKRRVIALTSSRTLHLVPGKGRTATIKLTAAGRSLLRHRNALKVVVTVTAIGATGESTRRFTLRP